MRFLLFLCLLLVPLAARAQELTVFAAASLTDAMKDVSAQWVKAGHQPLRMSFGSSSTLARQIEQGAPANLFASADEKWMDYLAEKNLIVADTRKDLLGNDLVLVVPADKPQHVTIGPGFDLSALLGAERTAGGRRSGACAGRHLRRAGAEEAGHVGQRRAAAGPDRRRPVRPAAGGTRRGAGRHRLCDRCRGVQGRDGGGDLPGQTATIRSPIRSRVTKAGDTPEARALLTFLAGPQARAVFVQRGFKVE